MCKMMQEDWKKDMNKSFRNSKQALSDSAWKYLVWLHNRGGIKES